MKAISLGLIIISTPTNNRIIKVPECPCMACETKYGKTLSKIRFKKPIIDGASVPFQKWLLEGSGSKDVVGKPFISFPLCFSPAAPASSTSRRPIAPVPAAIKKIPEPDLMIFD
jgi:hypothetical protein